jgi:hypothetical protein
LTRLTFQITHATDSDANAERNYIINELVRHRALQGVRAVQSGQQLPAEHVNHYVSDGEIMLARLAGST